MVINIGCHKKKKVFDGITVIYNEEAIISVFRIYLIRSSCIQ